MDVLLQQILNGVVLGSIYALIALGYTMVYGILQLINFAHGDVLMVGALTAYTVVTLLNHVAPDLYGPVKLVIGLIVAMPVCMLLNVAIERVAYRPLRNAPRLAPLITAIGVSIILQTLAMMIWGRNYKVFPPLLPSDPIAIGNATVTPTQLIIIVTSIVVMLALVLLINRSKLGRAMRATAENPRVAGLMGVDANKVIVATFAIGAALAALAGVMIAANYSIAHFYMGFMPGLKAFTAAVLGGIGNIYGAMVGGMLLGLIEALGAGYIGDLTGGVLGSHYQDIFAFIVLIVVLIFRPQGIMGDARRRPSLIQEILTMIQLFFPQFKDNPRAALFATVLLAITLAILPFVAGAAGNAWVRIIDFALLYILLALGLNIVIGFAGLLDLGYIAFYAVGAYMYALLASSHLTDNFEVLAQLFPDGFHSSIWLVIPLGAGLAALAGVLLGFPVLRLRGDYLAIVTLGFGEIIRIFMLNLNAPVNITNGPQGINMIDSVKILGFDLGRSHEIFGIVIPSLYWYYYLFLGLVILSILFCIRLQNSRIGRAWMALREDEIAAKAMGINTRNIKLLAFAMGATFGGVAGAMFAAFQGFISPESFSLHESIIVLAMVVLGGMGHIPGVVLGAILLAGFPEFLRHTAGPVQDFLFGKELIAPEILRMLVYGLAMVLVMLYRPKGLWPAPEHGVNPVGKSADAGARV